MTPERWQQIDSLFQAALELPPEQRDSFIAEACGGDDALRSHVEALLASDERGLSFIDSPAFEVAAGLLAGDEPGLAAGAQIGHYKILSLLGTGGMGEIYLAEDSILGRQVALKILYESLVDASVRFKQLQREARAASAISHPNVAHVYEIGEADGHNYIAMEYVRGESLREHLKGGRLREEEAVSIAAQVASALAAAHEAGVVHRDIKPENVMLLPDGHVKVLDFGLAKLVGLSELDQRSPEHEGATNESVPGLIMGTIHYMSPEQVCGKALDARTDLWSLGVVLYEMVTGRKPFTGRNRVEVAEAILHQEPQPPDAIEGAQPKVSRQLSQILSKALNKEIDKRYESAQELKLDLVKAGQRPAQSPDRATNRRSKKMVASAVIVAALLVTALITVLAIRRLNVSSAQEKSRDEEILLELSASLQNLNDKARARAQASTEMSVQTEVDSVTRSLSRFEKESRLAGTEQGEALSRRIKSFIKASEDSKKYAVEGYTRYREITLLLDSLFADAATLKVNPVGALPSPAVTVPNGFVVETAYSGPPFMNPRGLGFAPDGRLIVTDMGPEIGDCNTTDGAVFAINPDGSVATLVRGQELQEPISAAFGPKEDWGDDLYISDENSVGCDGRIFRLDKSGRLQTFALGAPWIYGGELTKLHEEDKLLGDPDGLAFGKGGALGTYMYVADMGSHGGSGPGSTGGIFRIKPNGEAQTFAYGQPFVNPFGLAVAPLDRFGGKLYVADYDDYGEGGHIWKIDANGSVQQFAGGPGSPFLMPSSLAFSPGGAFGEDMYVLDHKAGIIFRINDAGNISIFAFGLIQRFEVAGITFSPSADALYFINGTEIMRIRPQH
jgi:serine/threonine protein kinase/sugar lactone lactonase YvrE